MSRMVKYIHIKKGRLYKFTVVKCERDIINRGDIGNGKENKNRISGLFI